MLGSLKQSTSNEEIYKASNCTLFVQQLWRNEICKHCFKTESEHTVNISRSNENINSDNNIGTTLTTSNNNNINSPTTLTTPSTTPSTTTTITTPNKNINNYIKNFNNNNNNNNTTTSNSTSNNNNNNNSNYYLTPNKYCKVTSKSSVVPSVEKAPLSIRRSLTPSAIEKFSRQISSQLLVQEPLSPKTIINNINTNNNPLSPPQRQKPPLPLKTYIDTTSTNTNTTYSTSANSTPDLSSPNLTSFSLDSNTQQTTTTATTSSSSSPTPIPNTQQQQQTTTTTSNTSSPSQSSPILLSLSEFHQQSPSRQMRSHSDSPADYNISVSTGGSTTTISTSSSSVTNSLSLSNASTSSLSSTNSSNSSSSSSSSSKPISIANSNLIYEKKHTRNLSGSGYNSLGSSPINSSPLLFSQQQQLQAQSSRSINSLQSSSNNNSISSSSPRKYSIFVGKSKQSKMNNQNHVNNQSTPNLPKRQLQHQQQSTPLKSSSYPNVADATHQHLQHQINFQLNNSILSNSQITLNEEQNKIFYAINSILSSLPGISNNAVFSIMDILYSQSTCIDIDSNNTLIKPDKLADLTKATVTFQKLIERQDYLRDVITVQSCVRRFLSKRRTEWLSQVYNGSILKDRNNEFRGLIQLERKYNEKLDITINTYYRPLKAANLISRMDLQSIFSSTKEIYYVHKRILLQFEELFKKFPTLEGIGDLILRIAPELKIYGGYVKNFKNAIDTLISCQENPKFASFLKECCDNTPGKVYDLMALIAAPLNHLTGYERQLFNIALYTPQNWPDYVNVINAVTMMKEVEHLVQDNLGQAQNAATLMTIYRKINNRKLLDPFVIPTRIFIHEGRLVKFELKKQDQIYFYYLCNDLILFVKKGNGLINSSGNNGGSLNNSNSNNSGSSSGNNIVYKLKNMFMLQDVIVSDLQDTAVHKNIISILNNPTKEIYSFSIEDPREKKELVKQFSKLCMMSTNKSTKIFGISLVDLIQREEDNGNTSDSITGGIPTFLIKLCNEILGSHLHEEGIFRISPNQSELDILKESLNKSATSSLMDQSISKANGHQLAALLKSFFRELSIPLLTFELFDKVIEFGDTYQDTNDIDYQISEIRSLLSTIPIVNQNILQLVLLLLTQVAANHETNKMSSINLAIVFAPNLLKPKNQTIETSLKIPIINNVITTLLDNYQLLYSDKLNSIKIVDSKFQFNCVSTTSSSSKTNNNSFNYSKK